MTLKTNAHTAKMRKVDEDLTIHELLADDTMSFDLVLATLTGGHPRVVNRVSDRAYYILSGTGNVFVGGESLAVEPGDTIRIRKGTPHSISGHLSYLIVTSPPFSPENEQVL